MPHSTEALIRHALREGDEDPRIVFPQNDRLRTGNPDLDALLPYGFIPAGGALGASIQSKTPIRNTILGALAGAGALGGGYLGGKLMPDDRTAGMVGGGLAGGLASLLAARAALKYLFPGRYDQRPKFAAAPVIAKLKQLKAESDRHNWKAKHALIQELLMKYPDDFKVDSEDQHLVGLTHKSGFRFHTPRRVLPSGWKSRLSPEAFMLPELDLPVPPPPGIPLTSKKPSSAAQLPSQLR